MKNNGKLIINKKKLIVLAVVITGIIGIGIQMHHKGTSNSEDAIVQANVDSKNTNSITSSLITSTNLSEDKKQKSTTSDKKIVNNDVIKIENTETKQPTEPKAPKEPAKPIASEKGKTSTGKGNYKEYFNKDVFMGDSITDAISYYEILDEGNVCSKIGININRAINQVEQISIQNPRNIFLLYGVNDMEDTMPSKWFVGEYRKLVKKIKSKFPNSNIYVQSILPVDSIVEKKTPHINNKHINECNTGLVKMAKEENVKFINIASVLNENNKNLYEPDGTHFKETFYNLWLNYLMDNLK